MKYRPSKIGTTIQELKGTVLRYGCSLTDNPPYVLVGQYNSKAGPWIGILAAAPNEFYAYIIRREMQKSGKVKIERTEFHQDTTFSIELYKEKIRLKMEEQKQRRLEAQDTER
jgi:hypothetical protein